MRFYFRSLLATGLLVGAYALGVAGGVVPLIKPYQIENHTPTAATNAALTGLAAAYAPNVIRLGVLNAGDADPQLYTLSANPCSLNAGAGDTGLQVPTSDGKCWIASPPAAGMDVRQWGAVAGGRSGQDNTTQFQTAVNDAPTRVIIPATALGFYIGGTVTYSKEIEGVAWNPVSPDPTSQATFDASYAGQSTVLCSATALSCFRTKDSGTSQSPSPFMAKLNIVGSLSPASGAVGWQFYGGYNAIQENMSVVGFDICMRQGPLIQPAAIAPIRTKNTGVNLAYCQTYYDEMDASPEVTFVNGTWGVNNQTAMKQPKAVVHFTKTGTEGAGGGPNTFTMIGTQINANTAIGCDLLWSGFIDNTGTVAEFRFTDVHMEFGAVTYTGGGQHAIFCTDSSVATLNQLWVRDSSFNTGSGSYAGDVFALDAATKPQKMRIEGSEFIASAMTLALPAGGSAVNANRIEGNSFNLVSGGCALTGNASQYFTFKDNSCGASLSLTGAWGLASFDNNIFAPLTALTDTATGHISWKHTTTYNWTPVLNFGGASVGVTYSSQSGLVSRTSDGGFEGAFTITLASKGSSTGAATITGLPYGCSSGQAFSPARSYSGISASAGVVLGLDSSIPSIITLSSPGATGYTAVADTAFTNTSSIFGAFKCNSAN